MQLDLNHYEAMTFDVGGTLLEPWPSVGHVYAAVAADAGWPGLAPQVLNEQFARAWQRARPQFDYSLRAWQSVATETFAPFLSASAVHQFFGELYQRFAHRDVWRMYEDVIPTLVVLKQRGFRLAILSNWDERLESLLEECELTSWFDRVLISGVIGIHKPCSEVFFHAARALGLPPDRILHVGDGVQEDLEGANQAGFGAVILKRATANTPGAIATLRELWDKAGLSS